jgi:ubiquitin C-terminal hydrolase
MDITFYESMMCVLLEIKVCSYKGTNTFHTTQQEISNKSSHFFDIYSEVGKLGNNEFRRTNETNEFISQFLDEIKNKVNDNYSEQNIFENLPHIIDLDGHIVRKTADIMMSYIQEKSMMLSEGDY